VFFNLPGSRNLGVKMASSDYVFICDMDTIVTPECANKLLDLIPKENIIFKFNRKVNNVRHEKHLKIHPGIFLVNRKSYLDVNGCDEDLAGNYGNYTRSLEYKLIKLKSFKIFDCSDIFVEYIIEGDCDIQKDKSINRKKFNKKVQNGSWSKDMIRFNWIEL
jgi:GT2 family glycosyltransferase